MRMDPPPPEGTRERPISSPAGMAMASKRASAAPGWSGHARGGCEGGGGEDQMEPGGPPTVQCRGLRILLVAVQQFGDLPKQRRFWCLTRQNGTSRPSDSDAAASTASFAAW